MHFFTHFTVLNIKKRAGDTSCGSTMGEINRDGHLDLDPKSRLGLEEVPDSSRHFGIGRDGHLDCRDKKVREGWDFSSINPDFLSRNSRKLAQNIGKSRGQSRLSLASAKKIGYNFVWEKFPWNHLNFGNQIYV